MEQFSKLNKGKRHLYGEKGVLGHRRALSSNMEPFKKGSTHRRTQSNTAFDFNNILPVSPRSVIQEEPLTPDSLSSCENSFIHFLDNAINDLQPKPPQYPANDSQVTKLRKKVSILKQQNSQIEKDFSDLSAKYSKIKEELDRYKSQRKHYEQHLGKLKAKTLDLELALARNKEPSSKDCSFKMQHKKSYHNKSLSTYLPPKAVGKHHRSESGRVTSNLNLA